jgi:hypothetical protein
MIRLRFAWLGVLGASVAAAVIAACGSFASDDTVGPEAGADAIVQPDGERTGDAGASDAAVEASSYRAAVLADGPLVYWRMGTPSGLLIHDETGRGNDLVLQGPPTSYKLEVPGALVGDNDTAVQFDGTAGHAKAVRPREFDFMNGSAFTIELWAKRDAIDAGHTFQQLLSKSEGPANDRSGFQLYVVAEGDTSGPKTVFERNSFDGGDRNVNTTLVAPGRWAHYAAVFDDTTRAITLYIDGTSATPIKVPGALSASIVDLAVASDSSGTAEFPGSIDEVAIYAKALSLAQIANHKMLGRP